MGYKVYNGVNNINKRCFTVKVGSFNKIKGYKVVVLLKEF